MTGTVLIRRTVLGAEVLREFWCPACKMEHAILLRDENPGQGPRWTLSGTAEKPTLSPSVNVTWSALEAPEDGGQSRQLRRCHFHIVEGMIDYCSDSTHHLKGMKIPMKGIDPEF